MTTLSLQEAIISAQRGGFSSAESITAAAIGTLESGRVVEKVGGPNGDGSYDYGWMQINSVHNYDKAKLTSDADYTSGAAYAIYKAQGWDAWVAYKTKKRTVEYQTLYQQAAAAHRTAVFDGKINAPVLQLNDPNSLVNQATGGAVAGAATVVGAATSGIGDVLGLAGKALGALTSGEFWRRLGIGALGLVLIVAMFVLMLSSQSPTKQIAKLAGKS